MVRISKQNERRQVSPRRPSAPRPKTGPLRDKLPLGYKEHVNAIEGQLAAKMFIPKIR